MTHGLIPGMDIKVCMEFPVSNWTKLCIWSYLRKDILHSEDMFMYPYTPT
jgi:hypothetical protein